MALKFAAGVRAFWVAVALLMAMAFAGEPRSPLLGLTRDQVIEQLGEPKSQIAAGNRLVMFFERERLVLRDGRVTEVDFLTADPAAKRMGQTPSVAPTEPGTVGTAAPPATGTGVAPTPTAPGEPSALPRGDVPEVNPTPATAGQAPGTPTTTAPTGEPQLSIKFVRPPGAPAPTPRPAPKEVVPPPAPSSELAKGAATPAPLPATPPGQTVARDAVPPSAPTLAVASSISPVANPSLVEPPAVDKPDEPLPEPEPKQTGKGKAKRRSASEPDIPDTAESIFTGRTYLFAFVVIAAGAVFLMWQRNQRQLELAASSVSRTPFSPTQPTTGGAMFPAALLNDLEWKRFEELVAAYYVKTGVVADRTKTGPNSPVHIKISWKGEPRPFALVHCIAHPTGLIDVQPVQALFAVLTAEDIRRGYVVTTGKFNIPARDFAEEKHITLMSGDIFLEKINALPPSARTELSQEFSTGDYTTPSCPKCETKMVKTPEEPNIWRCKTHPEVTIPVWK